MLAPTILGVLSHYLLGDSSVRRCGSPLWLLQRCTYEARGRSVRWISNVFSGQRLHTENRAKPVGK
jgi:hypothetical protein